MSKPRELTSITIRIPPKEKERLERLAAREDRSVSSFLRRLLAKAAEESAQAAA